MQWTEFRYTLKLLRKNFGFSLLCVSALALGLGIVLPVYSLVDNLALKEIPLPAGERFVSFSKELASSPRGPSVSNYDAFHWQYFKANAHSFDVLEAWHNGTNTLSDDGKDVATFKTVELTPTLLTATKIQPLLGRLFNESDQVAGAEPVALIGESVWQSYYSRRQDIVGHVSRINGEARTIIGVLPKSFGFPINHKLWLPLPAVTQANSGEGAENLILTGILAQGVSRASADKEIELLQQKILSSWPEQYKHIKSSKVDQYSQIFASISGVGVYIILAFLGSIMLLVATNIGNLFVARSEERITELAIRSALGASTRSIASALLLESLVICTLGLVLGLTLAYFALNYLNNVIVAVTGSMTDFFWWDMRVNLRMLLASTLATLAIWIISGGLPAWRLCRTPLTELMASSSKGLGGQATARLSKVLVNVQLFIGCLLLSLSILLATVQNTGGITTMADSDKYHTAHIDFSAAQAANPQEMSQYLDSLALALTQVPDIERVAFGSALPGQVSDTRPYVTEDRDSTDNSTNSQQYPSSYVVTVSPNYFELLNIGLHQGRLFANDDTATSLRVAVIDQRLADELWPQSSALGKRLKLNPDVTTSPWLTVIGVSNARVMENSLAAGTLGKPVVYLLDRQAAPASTSVIVKSRTANFNAGSALLSAASQTNRDVAFSQIESVRAIEKARGQAIDFNANTFYFVIFVSLYLTSTSTYGLAARTANRRRIETGIRMALGANQAAALKVFLKDGMRNVSYGLGIGGVLSVGLLYAMLNNNSATSSNAIGLLIPTVLGISLLMGSIVMLANYLPARRIVNMEPADALRYE